MKVMISRNERGRALIKTVDSLNLQDLTKASDDQIKAVTDLAWEIKTLFHALISGKASDVLGDLNIGGGAKLSASLVADLTASIPRDVVISAQQQWLPNLATEMANGPGASDRQQDGWVRVTTEPVGDSAKRTRPDRRLRKRRRIGRAAGAQKPTSRPRRQAKKPAKPNAIRQRLHRAPSGQCLVSKDTEEPQPSPEAARNRLRRMSGRADDDVLGPRGDS